MYSIVDYTATEDQENFNVTMPYIDEDHIHVYINGTEVDAQFLVFNSPTVVTLTDVDIDTPHPDVDAGDTVRVRRITPIDEALVDFSNGANLGEADLDTQNLQSIYLLQEMQDNHANAIDNENTILAAALEATAAAAAALASETDAETAAAAALVSETNAETAETNAETAQAAAEAARDAALAAQVAAELAETNAETAETNAELAETNAETAETNAEAAQAAAEAARDAALIAETNAETAETNAETAEINAEAAQAAAEAAALAAEGHADDAEASAIAAAASAASVGQQSLGQTFRNLYLRSHPNVSETAKVMLVSADEIVMNDGERTTGWSQQTADLTVSGAGGLDTGSRVASTWYEVYAIRKSSDGTKNLLFHRMKDYHQDAGLETGDDSNYSLGHASPAQVKVSQGITPATTGPCEFIDVKLDKSGTVPAGQVWITIEGDNAGKPNNTVLATSDKIDSSSIEAATSNLGYWVRFYFRTPVTLTASTQYHFVLQQDFTLDNSNNVSVRTDTTSPPASGGTAAHSTDGTTWTTSSNVLMFRYYCSRNDAALTMPSGYDQYCKIGQVFNESGNTIHRFRQRDRFVSYGHNNTPTGYGILDGPGITDKTVTVAMYPEPGGGNNGPMPWNAYKVYIVPEIGYSANPASTAIASLRIMYESSFTDNAGSFVTALSGAGVGGVNHTTILHFPDVASQRYRYNLLSSDPGTSNKFVIITHSGYEWA